MSARSIFHITITSGDCRDSFLKEIDRQAMEACQGMIEASRVDGIKAGDVAIVGCPGYSLISRVGDAGDGDDSEACLKVDVYAQDKNRHDLICHIGIASKDGEVALWKELCQDGTWPFGFNLAGTCPSAPWCGVTLVEHVFQHSDALLWLGDFERCLAWAWIAHAT